MKAIVNTGPGELCMREWPVPRPGMGQVRVRTGACGICATDLQMIDGWERTGYPSIPGHEWAGTVDAVGAHVDPGLVGHRCVAENVLPDGGEVGFEHPGGYGEYLLTEAHNLCTLPDDFPLHVGALIEPLAVSVRAMRRLRLQDVRSALVLGDGPIGLLMLVLLRRAGVERIVVIGGRAGRLALAGLIVAALAEGKDGILAVLRRMVRWRAHVRWYIIILLFPMVTSLVAVGVHVLLGGTAPQFPLLKQNQHLILLTFIFYLLPWQSSAFLEEIGFRGYAQEKSQNRWGPLVGTLILGAFFGAWLLPEFLRPDSNQFAMGGTSFYPWFILTEIGWSVMMT